MVYFRLLVSMLFVSFLLYALPVSAQKSVHLCGLVMDVETGEGLASATVVLVNRTGGARTDSVGKFCFSAPLTPGDSLQIRYVGYTTQSVALTEQAEQTFQIKLQPLNGSLGEVVVSADRDPGKALMKKVLAHNRDNDPTRFGRLDARRWIKAEVAVWDPKVANDRKAAATGGFLFGSRIRAFEKVRSPQDTLLGQTPLFFSEKITDYTLQNNPFTENERVLATKTTGLESDKLLEPLARWNAGSVNLYAARVMLFSKAFVSPVGNEAFTYYDFYIVDSTTLPNGHHAITLQPIPKVWQGNVFTGRITVEDSTYALTDADLRLSKAANLNYIDSLHLHQRFSPAIDLARGCTVLVPQESTLTLRYEAGLELVGIPLPANLNSKRLVSQMRVVFDSVRVNDPQGVTIAAGALVSAYRSRDCGASSDFWKKNRPDSLSQHEIAIYRMVDILRNDPRQRIKDQLLSTIGSGAYYAGDKVYFGPLGALLSFNHLEGTRFRVGFRTMEGVSKNVGWYGHLAYGTGDRQVKGGLGVKFLWCAQPYRQTELYAKSDYNAITQWYDEIDKDGFINSLLRKNVPYYETYIHQIILTHNQQIGSNWFLGGGLGYRSINPSFDFRYPNPDFQNSEQTPGQPFANHIVSTAEATITLRFAWHESARIFDYERLPTAGKFPTVTLGYTQGFRFAAADFKYRKVNLAVAHTSRLTPKLALLWNLNAGKIFGVLPALLLEVPRGNDTYVMSRYVFNTMQPYEFAADRYLSWQSRLALGGLLFDRVPFLHTLGWRERLAFNAFWGDLRQNNRDFNAARPLQTPSGNPFMEAGVGVENIFHLFSIDYVRRLNYFQSPGAAGNRHGIFLGMKVVF